MARIIDENRIQTTIQTVQGIASYSHTEVENKNEKWDDHWQTSNGEYVIHENINHHIYLLNRKVPLNEELYD